MTLTIATEPGTPAGRIASLLGLDDPEILNDVLLTRRVENGLPWTSAVSVNEALPAASDVCALQIISKSTLRRSRQASARLSKRMSVRLYNIARVIEAAQRVSKTGISPVELLLAGPHPALAGRSPLAIAQLGAAGTVAAVNALLSPTAASE